MFRISSIEMKAGRNSNLIPKCMIVLSLPDNYAESFAKSRVAPPRSGNICLQNLAFFDRVRGSVWRHSLRASLAEARDTSLAQKESRGPSSDGVEAPTPTSEGLLPYVTQLVRQFYGPKNGLEFASANLLEFSPL